MMNEKKRLEKFNQRVFDAYKKTDHFDKIKYQMVRCREILMKENYLFSKMSVDRQYELCSTILCIAMHTSTNELRKFRVFSSNKNTSDLEYSLIKDYKEPSRIEVVNNNVKLINNEQSR